MKTMNINRICNRLRVALKHSALAVAMGAAVIFGTEPSAKAAITYDFDTDQQGWMPVLFDTTGDPMWGSFAGWGFIDEDAGDSHLQNVWGGKDTALFRSPEFTLDGSGDLTFQLLGTAGLLATPVSNAEPPVALRPSEIPPGAYVGSAPGLGGGFTGVALRDVAADTYVLSKAHPGTDFTASPVLWTDLSFTAAELAPYVLPGVKYTLDFIDYDKSPDGEGAWSIMNNVSIPGVLFYPTNDNFADAITLPGNSGTQTGTVKVTMQDAPAAVEKLEVTVVEVAVHFVPKAQAGGEDTQSDTAMSDDASPSKSKKPYMDTIAYADVANDLGSHDILDTFGPAGDVADTFGTSDVGGGDDTIISDIAAGGDSVGSDAGTGVEISTEIPAEDSDDPYKAGWRVVLKDTQVFDLIALKDNPTQLGLLTLGEGKITQVRLVLAEENAATVTIGGEQFPVSVPSGVIKLTGNFDIVAGQETAVKLDFDAQQSLKQNGQGEYRLQPVVKFIE